MTGANQRIFMAVSLRPGPDCGPEPEYTIATVTRPAAGDRDRILSRLERLPAVQLASGPSPIEEMPRLRTALGDAPRLLVKRDDALPFAFGGNKVRKLALVAGDALGQAADTLITAGGLQSNHARVTAAAAARLGLDCLLVVNGQRPERPTANALLESLCGASIHYVGTRAERAPAMQAEADRLAGNGRRPYVIPIGASTPLGAAAFVAAAAEMAGQGVEPDVIVHSSSSGGTQAGLVAGCAALGLRTRVVGVSADEPAAELEATVRRLIEGLAGLLEIEPAIVAAASVRVDDRQVGDGYGHPTRASREAMDLAARMEGLFLDPTYTAKALAGLVAAVREGRFDRDSTVLFWHTGGQVGLFA
jgi:1-aminocyclopropane-1-carboxylate deaminase/D-cysteine desulfhydrase-like pyridoxal-dependent ACC family enzyme